jgi:hypothetical protein
MPSATFEARLKRLTADAASGAAPSPGSGSVQVNAGAHRISRSALDRFDAGLALIRAARLRAERMFWLRLLARMGVPVAPWPYWSAVPLLAVFVLFPILFFGAMLRLIDVIETANKIELHSPPIDLLRWFGMNGVIAATLLLAPVAVWRNRRVARRAGLPDWSRV